MTPVFPHTLRHTLKPSHITPHHGRRLCEPFNIWLNNAAAFLKPGVVSWLIPCRLSREISGIFIFFPTVTIISLFPRSLSGLHFLCLTFSPTAALLIISCPYPSIFIFFLNFNVSLSIWLLGSLLSVKT